MAAPVIDLGQPEQIEAITRCAFVLARRFAAGATLWCAAPEWPEHARHVAVEFVHPVIVGTRALPAVSVSGPDPVAQIREVVRSGDLVVALGRADDPTVLDLLARAPAWGATTVWIASGAGAPPLGADHLLWVDDHDGAAPFDGRMVLRYHLLWELTHVCFEHPGLLAEPAVDADEEVCITCSDEGRVAEVVGPAANGIDTRVRTAEGVEEIDTSLVGSVTPHDLVLVHAGTAISTIESPARAQETSRP